MTIVDMFYQRDFYLKTPNNAPPPINAPPPYTLDPHARLFLTFLGYISAKNGTIFIP